VDLKAAVRYLRFNDAAMPGDARRIIANGTSAALADAATVRSFNALAYLGARGVTTAQHWRIRHGTKDRDTSSAQ
jgi:hypothetical protein